MRVLCLISAMAFVAGAAACVGSEQGGGSPGPDASADTGVDGTVGTESGAGSDASSGGATADGGVDAMGQPDEGPPACGPATCSGCCEADGGCITSPASAGICGAGGNTCAKCAASSPCTSGICLGCGAPSVILGSSLADPSIQTFPAAVAASGSLIVLGASGTGSGSAYVATQSGGDWTTVPLIPSAVTYSDFGSSVAVSGSWAFVGGLASGKPSAFVFHQVGSSWLAEQVLPAAAVDAGYVAAPSLAVDGDTLLVGGGNYESPATVYVTTGSAWTEQATLQPTEAIVNLAPGGPVAVNGDTALVAVTATDTTGNTARWADVFVRSGMTWTEQATLAPAGLQANNNPHATFSAGISGDLALIASNFGAWVYERSGGQWTQQADQNDAGVNIVPLPSDGAFGIAMAVTNGAAVVGDTSGFNGGYTFLLGLASDGWHQTVLSTFDAGAGGPLNFGDSVARSGSLVVVGAPGDTQFVSQGAALVYSCSP